MSKLPKELDLLGAISLCLYTKKADDDPKAVIEYLRKKIRDMERAYVEVE